MVRTSCNVLPCATAQVVVHNLPWTCTWQQLKDAFTDAGVQNVERADVIIDSAGRSRSALSLSVAVTPRALRDRKPYSVDFTNACETDDGSTDGCDCIDLAQRHQHCFR